MYNTENKKVFLEPECKILTFQTEDILTSSDLGEDNWDLGEF